MKLEDGGNKRQPSLKGTRESHAGKCHLRCCVTSISLSRPWRKWDQWERSLRLQLLRIAGGGELVRFLTNELHSEKCQI